jgi:Sigma-70, region 4
MTPAQREAFMLLRCEYLSVSKAAERLGASKGAVKIRIFRASGAIRQALSALDHECPSWKRMRRSKSSGRAGGQLAARALRLRAVRTL